MGGSSTYGACFLHQRRKEALVNVDLATVCYVAWNTFPDGLEMIVHGTVPRVDHAPYTAPFEKVTQARSLFFGRIVGVKSCSNCGTLEMGNRIPRHFGAFFVVHVQGLLRVLDTGLWGYSVACSHSA